MGLSVFPAPSTGPSVPTGLMPPTIAFSTSHSVTSLPSISNFTAGPSMLAYRKTDNSLYWMGGGSGDLYRFNLSNNTGSRVSTSTAPVFGANKDFIIAQDGVMYAAEQRSDATATTIRHSSDGGLTFTNMPANAHGNGSRGFLGLIDNGQFQNVTGNIVWQDNGWNSVGTGTDNPNVFINNVQQGDLNSNVISAVPLRGARASFPIRDGDDNPSGSRQITTTGAINNLQLNNDANNANTAYIAVFNSVITANLDSGNRRLFRNHYAPVFDWVSASTDGRYSGQYVEFRRPTCIQSQWVVGSSITNNVGVLNIYNANNNFAMVGATQIPLTLSNVGAFAGLDFSNPIYVSATKKLYVLAIRYSSGVGDGRILEFNVTTN